jgi:lipopolysaccharide export system protein LptA
MRFTIERLRTLVLVAGVLLVVALGVFLGLAKFRNRFIRKDLPQRLGLNIQEEAKDFVLSHSVGPHMQYKIRASKQVQLKQDGKVMLQLHDVVIELYGEDGGLVDRIAGNEFDYNPNSGIAKADGPVDITAMKPTVAPSIAPKATASQALTTRQKSGSLGTAAQTASSGEIHVQTSGLVFDRNSGEASTNQSVQFTLAQGSGSAIGAKFDAHQGLLTLDREVNLAIQRGEEPVKLFAQHALFDRDEKTCELTAATIRYGNGASSAEDAKVHFRDDGSAERLDAGRGFSVITTTGGRLTAPTGTLEFDEHNQPRRGHLQGGVTMDSENKGRKVHGTSPKMDLVFAAKGELKSAHLERGVQIVSDEQTASPEGDLHAHRSWMSPVLDIAFRNAGKQKVEPAEMHGTGGVTIVTTSQHGTGPASPEKMTADEVTGEFGPGGTLTAVTGRGHTSIAQTGANGTQQTTSGDVLVAHLAPAGATKAANHNSVGGAMQIASATVEGNVVLTQQPAQKGGAVQPALRATAGRADYDSEGEWLHLTRYPRVKDGALELSSAKLDVSQESGNAFARGNVKATWEASGETKPTAKTGKANASGMPSDFGAKGLTHVVAHEAELQRSGVATFKGSARLWQQGNSIAAPVIVLDRNRQVLTAEGTDAKKPVQVVLVSATAEVAGKQGASKQEGSSVITIRGGELKYSGAERKAVMRAGSAGRVVASTTDVKIKSNEVELFLLPPGNHAGKNGGAAQLDRMTSTGDVEISSGERHGLGEKLVYTGDSGNYVLTGTSSARPSFTDPVRGTVTGEALIFNSRDDSVKVEGDGQKTTTVTTAPK